MYAFLYHKTTHEVSPLLHKQKDIQEERMAFSFQAKIAARGYHVYKNLAWSTYSNAKQEDFITVEIGTDKESKE